MVHRSRDRVRVQAAHRPRSVNRYQADLCLAQCDDGSTCGVTSLEYAPFPLCAYHAVRVYRFVKNSVGGLLEDPLFRVHFQVEDIRRDRAREQRRNAGKKYVVYYVQVGTHIKIGYTGNFRQRIQSYPPTRRVLAVEDGDAHLEQERHTQFAHLLDVGHEWFHPGPDLIRHINTLRAGLGSAPIRADGGPSED